MGEDFDGRDFYKGACQMFRHLRDVMVVSSFALALSFVVGGSLLTEIVFSYPGIGFTLLAAVKSLDYSLVQGIFLVITLVVLAANFVADIVYVALDPRTRQEA